MSSAGRATWSGVGDDRAAVAACSREGSTCFEAILRPSAWDAYICEVKFLARQLGEAAALAERTLLMSRERFERATGARALYLLDAIAKQSSDADLAGRYYTGALALAGELCVRPLRRHCHFGLGKPYRRTDRRDQAQDLANATTTYRDMN
jgi:hypothetical protein